MILIKELMTGNVSCKLSNISELSPKIFIRECIEGIRMQTVNPRNTTSTRKLHINFCQGFCAVVGQSPIKFKVKRFNFTAHSKSTYRNLDKYRPHKIGFVIHNSKYTNVLIIESNAHVLDRTHSDDHF